VKNGMCKNSLEDVDFDRLEPRFYSKIFFMGGGIHIIKSNKTSTDL
jgi:hypothetical protein